MPRRVVAFAPGRVNLIGEHTDYNGGLALPFAAEAGITVTAEPREDAGETIDALAADLGERDRFDAVGIEPASGWRAFVRGTVAELRATGGPVGALDLTITGNLPRGGGLSSSAALAVALALAILGAAERPRPDAVTLARLCSRVENEWVGARTGLLDQLTSLCGEPGQALRIDFGSLTLRHVPLQLRGHRLVTLDSGERHELSASGYNERRAECAAACEALGVASLSAASLERVAALASPLDRRARHVLTENTRVEAAIEALGVGDMPWLGALLSASHASLRDDYEVSTPAVEEAVARLTAAGALGARIIGGGFGGHVLGLFGPGTEPPGDAVEVRPGPGAHVAA